MAKESSIDRNKIVKKIYIEIHLSDIALPLSPQAKKNSLIFLFVMHKPLS